MIWKKKKVLITGCSGVIGCHLINYLIAKGVNILGIDLADFPKAIKYKNFQLIKKNLLFVKPREINNFSPEIIFHLAATFERSEESLNFWKKSFNNNVFVSHKVVDYLNHCQSIKKFIFASSYLVYDPQMYSFSKSSIKSIVLKETALKKPRNLTGAAKYYTEQEIEFLATHLKRKIQFINARIYRVYGPGSKDIISRWIKYALKGGTLELYNQENSFDYVYSQDVAIGLIKLAESDFSGAVNLGAGKSIPIEKITKIINKSIKNVKFKDKGLLISIEKSQADISLLKKITHWSPPINIETGIKRILNYEITKNEFYDRN